MRITEHYGYLRNKLDELFVGATFEDYGETTCGGKVVRGPHVTIMIPVNTQFRINHENFKQAVKLIDEHLCLVTWDNNIKYSEHGGPIYNGVFYELILDKVQA